MNKKMYNELELREMIDGPDTILCKIMSQNFCDKASNQISQHHNYSKFYDVLFREKRHSVENILEIGIGSVDSMIPSNMCGGILGRYYQPGASIRSWLEYFPKTQVFACDIDTKILPIFQDQARVRSFYLDQTNEQSIEKASENIFPDIKFDIIIDDGLHHFPTNVNVMNKLLHKVKKGGYYIIEDVIFGEYNCRYFDYTLLNDKNYQFITLPNPHNLSDNNLFVVHV